MTDATLSLRERLPAAAIHFALSLVLFIALMAVIVLYWYPGPFFQFDGGWRGTLIIVGVDLVLGPTLTFIVFNPRKGRGKILFDLTVIGLLQCVALLWGVSVVESQRPVAAALLNGAFRTVTAQTVRAQGYEVAALARLSDQHPALVYVQIPGDEQGRARVAQRRKDEGLEPASQIDLFVPLAEHLERLRAAHHTAEVLLRVNPVFRQEFDAFFDANPELDREHTFAVPFYGRYGAVMLMLDRNGQLIGTLTAAFKGILE